MVGLAHEIEVIAIIPSFHHFLPQKDTYFQESARCRSGIRLSGQYCILAFGKDQATMAIIVKDMMTCLLLFMKPISR